MTSVPSHIRPCGAATARQSLLCLHICLLWMLLAITGCASHTPLQELDLTAVQNRAETQVQGDVRVSLSILGADESQHLSGHDLAAKGVQPIWLKIENHTSHPVWFLPTGIDPEYFSPREVSYSFHRTFARQDNEALDREFDALGINRIVRPGQTHQGFVFANLDQGMRPVEVALVSDRSLLSFVFFAEVPETVSDSTILDPDDLYPAIRDYEQSEELRRALQTLPCCVSDPKGDQGPPLNLVLIGYAEDVFAAAVTRGYKWADLDPLMLFNRQQDIGGAKRAAWVTAQGHTTRFWLAPITFQGKPVWLVQTSQPSAGRAGSDQGSGQLDPDQARKQLVEDLLYSQGVRQFGSVRAMPEVAAEKPRETGSGNTYVTDGFRRVLVFQRDPVPLSEIEVLDWAM